MNKNKIIGIAIIALVVVMVGTFIFNYLHKEDKKLKDVPASSPVEQSSGYKEDVPTQSTENPNIKEVDEDITIVMPKEMQKELPIEKLKEAIADFLDENQLMTKDTTATSDGNLIINYEKHTKTFNLVINNYGSTVITVLVEKDGNISFSYR